MQSITYCGWPNLEEREERVLVRIFQTDQGKHWGLLARGDASVTVHGLNTPLIWVELNKNVVCPLFFFFFCECTYYN